MHPRTIATLHQLDKADWFSRVGVKDTEIAIVLASWDDAVAHCSSVDWENLCLEAANQYCERLFSALKGMVFDMEQGCGRYPSTRVGPCKSKS